MARRIIIGEILNLIKGLGGNPSKFMGTKSNINFLGKGPKAALFQGQIDTRGMVAGDFPLETVISEAETAGGYAAANKLNDLQLQRLKDNLLQLKKIYQPEQIPNVTDLGTGTKDLTQEGIASLRREQDFKNFFTPERSKEFKSAMTKAQAESDAMKKAGLDPSKQSDYWKWQEIKKGGTVADELAGAEGVESPYIMTRIVDRMKKIQKMSDDLGKGDVDKAGTYQFIDPTAEKASYASRFNPKNEVHVKKAEALLKDPQIKGVYSEAEVKNAYDFDGLYQSHFDKGHVDIARLFEQEGHNIPQMRASARDALLLLMKKERGLPGAETGLRDFVSAEDFKYITEGGGGRAGDPINLMVKYFGKNATENLPKSATKENINAFTDFIIKAKDTRGRGIDDPFFDRETIDFSTFTRAGDDIPFKTGGRVGFKYGSRVGIKKALAILNKNKKNAEYMFKASDNVSPGYAVGDTKYNAELLAEQLAEDAGVVLDDVDHLVRSEFYGTAYDYLAAEMGKNLLQKRNLGKITKALGTGEDLGSVSPAYGEKYANQLLKDWNPGKGRKPNASGGLAKILEV